MNTRKVIISAALAAAGLATVGGLVYAQGGPFGAENDAVSALHGARVGLTQAVASAEQHVGGRATSAELDREGQATIFHVEVVTPANTVMDVKLDADGKVLAAIPDARDDRDGDEGDGAEQND